MVTTIGAAALAALSLIGAAAPVQAGCTLEPKAEFKVALRGPRPVTPVTVNGTELDFLIDSGAFFSTITPAKASEVKLKPAYARGDILGVGGRTALQVADADSFRVGGRTLRDVQFVVAEGIGDGLAGAVGQSLLIAGDVDYDLSGGLIRLLTPKDCGDSPLAYWALGKPFNTLAVNAVTLDRPHTFGMVHINGKQVSVVFDTGASASVLKLEAARRLGLDPVASGAPLIGTTRGIGPKLARTWIVPVAEFRIGDEVIGNTHLRVSDFAEGKFDMLLGADFFRSHHVLIANSQHKLYFTYTGGPVFDLGPGASASASATAGPPTP